MDTHESRNDDHPRSHGGAEVALLPHQLDVVRDQGFRPEDVWWERKPGQRELNPLLLARIAERIQFDGDVPELRFGNLPEGGKPAVPVEADTTDPVLLGHMLRCASLDVQEELHVLETSWMEARDAKLEQNALALPGAMPVLSVPGYVPGQVPALRKIGITASEALLLSEKEKHEAAFTAIATTQGRVSFIPTLFRLLKEGLEARDLVVTQGRGEDPPVATAQWTLGLSQAKAHNPRFSPVVAAAAAMLRELLRALPETVGTYQIFVQPINTVHEREVGWKVAIYG